MPANFLAMGGLIVGVITLLIGVIILVWPRVIAYVIGIYFIIAGLLVILGSLR